MVDASTAEPLVQLRDVHKSYGSNEVIHGIDLDVPPGQITGLLGPSGHGKTTLVHMIVGALVATSGMITVLGETAPPRKVKAQIGFMPQSDALYEDLTATQNLRFFGSLYGLSKRALDEAIPKVLATVSLEETGRKTVAAFSGGMKRRLSLAVALIHSPRLLVLDEPTIGLDPVHRVRLWEAFRGLVADGATLIITTHVMDEAANCDDLLMIHDGRLIAHGSPAELVSLGGKSNLEEAFLEFSAQADTPPEPVKKRRFGHA
ncbi:MAG: ABC transporter ATP-binding protein [Propionibacteriaceae bacterium]|jgi:ABC-2 type transport system ATP-binding protein|nr:ABC transporter ATP-binding protein [Propionibacteriaceae bacterium]